MGHVNIHSFLNLKLKKMLTFSFENSTKISSFFFIYYWYFSQQTVVSFKKTLRVQETSTFIAKDVHVNSGLNV